MNGVALPSHHLRIIRAPRKTGLVQRIRSWRTSCSQSSGERRSACRSSFGFSLGRCWSQGTSPCRVQTAQPRANRSRYQPLGRKLNNGVGGSLTASPTSGSSARACWPTTEVAAPPGRATWRTSGGATRSSARRSGPPAPRAPTTDLACAPSQKGTIPQVGAAGQGSISGRLRSTAGRARSGRSRRGPRPWRRAG